MGLLIVFPVIRRFDEYENDVCPLTMLDVSWMPSDESASSPVPMVLFEKTPPGELLTSTADGSWQFWIVKPPELVIKRLSEPVGAETVWFWQSMDTPLAPWIQRQGPLDDERSAVSMYEPPADAICVQLEIGAGPSPWRDADV
jgi:hypothetical protein